MRRGACDGNGCKGPDLVSASMAFRIPAMGHSESIRVIARLSFYAVWEIIYRFLCRNQSRMLLARMHPSLKIVKPDSNRPTSGLPVIWPESSSTSALPCCLAVE